jgi:hypothetical protein
MHVIDDYLAAHGRYVEALEALDAIGVILRDVGEQLLANPHYVRFEKEAVWLERRVNGPTDGPASRSPWPTPERIREAIDAFLAAKEALVKESDVLVDARAPESLKKAVADRSGR